MIWPTAKLGDVAGFIRGINFKPDDVVPIGTAGAVACMRTKNVQAELDLSDVWAVAESFVRREEQFLQEGDILVSSANSWNLVGKCCWIANLPWRATFGGFISVLRSEPTKVDPRFLYRWFSSDRIQTTLWSFGQQTTNISNLNTERSLNLPLPFPPLKEQRRIADILDRAESLRAQRRAPLAKLDILTQAIFTDMFGDQHSFPSQPLQDMCELVTDGTHYTPEYAETGVVFLSARNVTSGYIDWNDVKFIPEALHRELHRRIAPRKNDILLAKNGTTGIAAIVDRDCVFDIYVSLALLRPRSEVLTAYLLGAINSPTCGKQFRAALKGIGVPNLHLKDIRQAHIPNPPIDAQRKFAQRIEAVERLRSAHRASLTHLDSLFASLQHRAFRGEL